MASLYANQTRSPADLFKAVVQQCGMDEGHSGLCWETEQADPSRGYVVYNDFEDCMYSWAIPPGFNLMNRGLLATVYLLWLMWMFFGVAIISDIFVESIESITNTTKKVMRKTSAGTMVEVEVPVWNWVVANITLMALGTSSPEILLATVETLMTLGQPAGVLGPSCIVGSAAYNLFMISAICTVALKPGQMKKIKHIWVFTASCAWSLWVYVWMFLVYKVFSPDEVQTWEAAVTLGMFPVMVYSCYCVDAKPWRPHPLIEVAPGAGEESPDLEKASSLSRTSAPLATTSVPAHHHSILFFRGLAVRQMASGGRDIKAAEALRRMDARQALGLREEDGLERLLEHTHGSARFDPALIELALKDHSSTKVTFTSPAYSVLERMGEARLKIMRKGGDMMRTLRVYWRTFDGTAFAGLDYTAVTNSSVVFGPGEELVEICIKVMDDEMSEPDVTFYVEIVGAEFLPMATASSEGSYPNHHAKAAVPIIEGAHQPQPSYTPVMPAVGVPEGVVLLCARVPVTIADDDDGGVLVFELPSVEAGADDEYAEVIVVRRSGADGKVSVEYSTRDGTALAGKHYTEVSSKLDFASGETQKMIRIPLLRGASLDGPGNNVLTARAFKLNLTNPHGGATLGLRTECRVIVLPHARTQRVSSQKPDKLGGKGSVPGDGGKGAGSKGPGTDGADNNDSGEYDVWDDWRTRFQEALMPLWEEEDEFGEKNTLWLMLLLHWINITWKLIGATIPPPTWKGGYPAFFVSLLYIAASMAVVKEVAELFGCMVGLSALMVGVSLVALGTSLPDTFASRLAAIHLEGADEAIGNITGSNCVNVLLGLGVPWVIATIYYRGIKKIDYITPAGGVGFFSIMYFCMSAPAIAILMLRRYQGGELGSSSTWAKWVVFGILAGFWVLFLALAGSYDKGYITSNTL